MKIPGWMVVSFTVGGLEGHMCAVAGNKLGLGLGEDQVPVARPDRHSSRQWPTQYWISF